MPRQTRNGRLDEALADLAKNQVAMQATQASLQAATASLINNQASFQTNLMALAAQTAERFARIEAELAEIRAILGRHEQLLEALPEAVRQRIGFEARHE